MASLVNAKGVDISSNNGNIDLAKVKAAGYKWVMIRCGYGSDIKSQDDTQFANNVAKAEKLGMPWGVYLFSYACSTSDAKSELAHIDRLLKAEKAKGHIPTLPIALDIEWSEYHEKYGGWTSSNLTNVATIILDGLKNLGYYPMIYTGYDELNMLNNHIRNDYDCWFAQWYTKPSSYKYNRLGMWQYGGEENYLESNSISGVGVIDKNYCYKDYPTIIKNGGYNGFKKTTTSTTTTTTKPSASITAKPATTTKPTTTTKVEKPIIYTQGVANSRWLGVITNGSTYSGILGKPLVGLAAKVNKGKIKYSVHIKGKGWLDSVTGFNYKDYDNGYAGDGAPAQKGNPIDAVKMDYTTPQDVIKKYGYYKVKYRVHVLGGDWLDWQYDTETTKGQDGYAGIIGKKIDAVEAKLVKA